MRKWIFFKDQLGLNLFLQQFRDSEKGFNLKSWLLFWRSSISTSWFHEMTLFNWFKRDCCGPWWSLVLKILRPVWVITVYKQITSVMNLSNGTLMKSATTSLSLIGAANTKQFFMCPTICIFAEPELKRKIGSLLKQLLLLLRCAWQSFSRYAPEINLNRVRLCDEKNFATVEVA